MIWVKKYPNKKILVVSYRVALVEKALMEFKGKVDLVNYKDFKKPDFSYNANLGICLDSMRKIESDVRYDKANPRRGFDVTYSALAI